jgi:Lar family restriction alleviation protein
MQQDALKPCPFCGSTNVRLWKHQTLITIDSVKWFVWCLECDAMGPLREQSEAISVWNRLTESKGER